MRRTLAVIGLLALVVLAGCGGGVVSEEALSEEATYEWETGADATINVTGSEFQAVLTVDNQSTVELYRRAELGGEEPVPISAIKFRYRNGTVLNASAIEVSESDSRTIVDLPAGEGQFAYTGSARSGELFVPVAVNGSHEVILPAGTRISAPIISGVEPGGYESVIEDDRVHIRWETITSDTITVSYYLERDLYLFVGLIGLVAAIAGGGWLYFRYQLRDLRTERAEAGLDMEDGEK